MHLSDETLDQLAHEELPPRAAQAARRHLAACPACAGRAHQALADDRQLARWLATLDTPPPALTPTAIAARAGRAGRTGGRLAPWAAAAAALLVAATGALALPGSPLRRFVHGAPRPAAAAPRREPPRVAPGPRGVTGLIVVPGDRVTVRLDARQAAGELRVVRALGAELAVRAVGGEAVAFTVGRETIHVHNRGAVASYELAVPATVRALRVFVAGRAVLDTTAAPAVVSLSP